MVAEILIHFDNNHVKLSHASLNSDRIATLDWLRARFFSKGLGYAGEVIDQAIKELKP